MPLGHFLVCSNSFLPISVGCIIALFCVSNLLQKRSDFILVCRLKQEVFYTIVHNCSHGLNFACCVSSLFFPHTSQLFLEFPTKKSNFLFLSSSIPLKVFHTCGIETRFKFYKPAVVVVPFLSFGYESPVYSLVQQQF